MEKFQALWAPNRSIPLVAHAPYTLNPASSKEDVRTFAQETIGDDLEKMEAIPGNYYNMHPGNHLGQGADTSLPQCCTAPGGTYHPAFRDHGREGDGSGADL